MATTRVIIVLAAVSAAMATLKLDDEGKVIGGKHAIRNTCTRRMVKSVDKTCVRFVHTVADDDGVYYLKLLRYRYEWEILEAEEGGYHIRHCHMKNDCKYWKHSGPKKRIWHPYYITLSDKPESRFAFESKGVIKHAKKDIDIVEGWHVETPSKEKPFTGTAFLIKPLPVKSKAKYVTYNRYSWLISDGKTWHWLITPEKF